MHNFSFGEFIALLKLQRLIDARRWKDAYDAAHDLEMIQKRSAPPPLNYHQDRPIREVLK